MSLVDHTSVATKFTKPAAIINGPKRLAGRRRHTKSPQSTYDSVRKAVSTAITSGSPSSMPTPSPATASVNEKVAAAHARIAIPQETDARGKAAAIPRSKPAAFAEAAMVLLSVAVNLTEPLRRGRRSRGGRKEASAPSILPRAKSGYSPSLAAVEARAAMGE